MLYERTTMIAESLMYVSCPRCIRQDAGESNLNGQREATFVCTENICYYILILSALAVKNPHYAGRSLGGSSSREEPG